MNHIKIITHNGKFHADDVCAVATILLALERSDFPGWRNAVPQIIRTRDAEVIATGDFVVDVGGMYDEENNRFDHHQSGGAGVRSNTIPYASFGLVWKKFGEHITGSKALAEMVDAKLVQGIDGHDNGVPLVKPLFDSVEPYFLNDFIFSFLPTWQEPETLFDTAFLEVVEIARALILREIKRAQAKADAIMLVNAAYATATDKRIVVLDHYMPWHEVIAEYPEPLFVIYPDADKKMWRASTVPVKGELFKSRKDFPVAWAGKRDGELAAVSGVADAVFCHNKLFLVAALSKEGVIELAKKAINA